MLLFMESVNCAKSKTGELAQEPSLRGTDNTLFQYIGDGGYGLIVNSDGIISNHNNPEWVGKPSSEILWLDEVISTGEKLIQEMRLRVFYGLSFLTML